MEKRFPQVLWSRDILAKISQSSVRKIETSTSILKYLKLTIDIIFDPGGSWLNYQDPLHSFSLWNNNLGHQGILEYDIEAC
jgi:hypothetical protein